MYENDNELAESVSSGDETAFEELIRLYGGLIKSIVHYHLKDIPMWQEDCVNEILLKIWQNIDRFDAEKNTLKNWIGAVAKYRTIDYKRKYYRELMTVELNESIADKKEVDQELLTKEVDEEINTLLANLKEKDRRIFIRYYIKGQSINEISKAYGKEPSWVYNRLSRGRKKLCSLFLNGRS